MLFNTLFYLVFLIQIILVSFYYPRKLLKRAKSVTSPASRSSELESKTDIDRRLQSYAILNNVMIALGLILLVLYFALDLFESTTAVLAGIGIYFLLQLSPLGISAVPDLLSGPNLAETRRDKQQDNLPYPSQLSDIVSPLPIGLASILFVTYVTIELLQWNGEWNTQLLRIGIFAFSNLLIATTIAWNLYTLKRGTSEERIERFQDLKKIVPALIFGSIGVSVYSLTKQLLIDLDLHQLRPILMSVFLQLLATLLVDLFTNITSNQSPIYRSRRLTG